MSARPSDLDPARAVSALSAIPATCDRATWVRAGMAAKAAGLDFDAFDAWSATGENYNAADARSTWRSFREDGGIGPGTLFALAKEHGWQGQASTAAAPRTPPPRPKASTAPKASPQAAELWQAGEPATAAHPYIARKLGRPDGLRVCAVDYHQAGHNLRGWLMVPARAPDGALASLQFIAPNKPASGPGKLNLKGAPMKGAAFVVGELAPDVPAYVAEGIGQAWSIHQATGHAAAVAFGAGSLEAVGASIKGHASRLVLVADRGKEREAEAAARRLGCAWVAPPPDLENGADVNDLHAREGLDAVRECLARAVRPAANDNGSAAPRFIGIGELLSAGLRPVDWLVRGFLERDALALLFGEPGAGKSFAAIDLACCIATGTPWHGNRTKPGAVFYLAGEGRNGLARRFSAWARHNAIALDRAPIAIATKPTPLLDAAAAHLIADAVSELAEANGTAPALIVIDTLSRHFAGGDENSSEDMACFVASLDELRGRFPGSTVLVVHHSGHADKTRARGSSVLKAAVDAEYGIARDETGIVRLECHKAKDAETPQPVAFRLERVGLGITDDEGAEVSSCAVAVVPFTPPPKAGKAGRGKNQTTALRVLRELYEAHQDRLDRGGFSPEGARVSELDWREALEPEGIDRRRFPEVREGLIDAGLIAREPGGFVRLL